MLAGISHSARNRMTRYRSTGEGRARHRDEQFQHRVWCSVRRSRFASEVRSSNSVCGPLQARRRISLRLSLVRSGELASSLRYLRQLTGTPWHANFADDDRFGPWIMTSYAATVMLGTKRTVPLTSDRRAFKPAITISRRSRASNSVGRLGSPQG